MFSVMIESVSDCGITIGNASISEIFIIDDHGKFIVMQIAMKYGFISIHTYICMYI